MKNMDEVRTSLRLTREEAEKVRAAAEFSGLSVTAFIRKAALARAVKVNEGQEV